jgi:hypothetical protein
MINVFDLAAVIGIVTFVIGGVFATILIVAAGIRAEEKVARERRSTTLRDEVTSDLTRGIRKLTGVGSRPRD